MDVTFDFAGQTAMVTGGAGGIGHAVAGALAEAGAEVVLVDRDPRVEKVAEHIGADGMVADLSRPETCHRVVADVVDRRGSIDLLVTAVGVQARAQLVEVDAAVWQELTDANFGSVAHVCAAAGRRMAAAGRGAIVNVSSMAAHRVLPRIAAYGSLKAAVAQYTRGLAAELGPAGVRVNGVAPGYIATAMTAEVLDDEQRHAEILKRTPSGRIGDVADVARPVLFLLSSAASFVNGHVLEVDGGYALT